MRKPLEKLIVCVDFDGTIVDHAYPLIGEPVPGAIPWLKKLQNHGAKIILWTMRSDHPKVGNVLSQAVEYLNGNGIDLYAINSNPSQSSWTNSPKAFAHIYIDDAAIGCPLIELPAFKRRCVDWTLVGEMLQAQFPDCF